MKKFLSFVCALAIVLSASAAPAKKAGLVKFAKTQAKELKAQKPLKAEKAAAFKSAAIEKTSVKALPLKKQFADQALKAAKAEKEALDVTIASWDIEDWGTDGELYLYGADNTHAFYFDLIYGGDAEDLIPGKTYTVADVYVSSETGEQYAGVFYDGDWHYGIKELSVVKTIDGEGLVHFVGSVVDSLDAAFTFHYDEEPFVPTGDTVTYAIKANAKMSYSTYFEDWTIKADDNVYGLRLDIYSDNAESPVGNYTTEDFDLYYTWVEVYSAPDSSALLQAVEAKASISTLNDTTFIAASILAEDGVVYELSAVYATPKKEAEVTIAAENLEINDAYYDWFGIVLATASNDDYEVYLSFYPDSAAAGYFGAYTLGSEASGDVTIYAQDSVVVDFYSGTFNLAKTEEGVVLTGKLLAFNNVEYTLDLKYVKPQATRQENILVDNAVLKIYPDYGDWQVTGFNADSSRFVAIDVYGDVKSGTFTLEDMDDYYTYIMNVIQRNDSLIATEQFNPIDVEIAVDFNAADSTVTIAGTYLGQGYYDDKDIPEFTLLIKAKVVGDDPSAGEQYDAEEDFIVDFADYTVEDKYLESYGVLFIEAETEKSEYISIELWLPETATALVAGEYAVSESEGEPQTVTYTTVDQYINGSFAGILTSDDKISVPFWYFAEGKVTVNEDLSIAVDVINTKGAKIQCKLNKAGQGIESTNAEKVAVKRLMNGQLVIEKNGVRYNAVGTILK